MTPSHVVNTFFLATFAQEIVVLCSLTEGLYNDIITCIYKYIYMYTYYVYIYIYVHVYTSPDAMCFLTVYNAKLHPISYWAGTTHKELFPRLL